MGDGGEIEKKGRGLEGWVVKKSKRRAKNCGLKKGVRKRDEEEARRAPKLGLERTVGSLGVRRGERDLIFLKRESQEENLAKLQFSRRIRLKGQRSPISTLQLRSPRCVLGYMSETVLP